MIRNPRFGGSVQPAAAKATGYDLNTFSMNRNFSAANVDVNLTYASGFKMYAFNFFGNPGSNNGITFNSDGSMTLTTANGFGSVGQLSTSPGYVGTSFSGGGYFEATLSFNPLTAMQSASGGSWPAWWLNATEHMCNLNGQFNSLNQQWIGQPANFWHWVECDIFEWDLPKENLPAFNTYTSTLHDWYGNFGVNDLPTGFFQNMSNGPLGTDGKAYTDWTLPHRYGCLWLPCVQAIIIGDGSTETFSGTINRAVVAGVFAGTAIISGSPVTWTDNGSGVLSGTGISGTINYTTGAWTLSFTTAPDNTTTVMATVSALGSFQFYLDDIPIVGNPFVTPAPAPQLPVTYTQYENQSPPPTSSTPWTYGVADFRHFQLLLNPGFASGPSQELRVYTVNVWQNTTAGNITN